VGWSDTSFGRHVNSRLIGGCQGYTTNNFVPPPPQHYFWAAAPFIIASQAFRCFILIYIPWGKLSRIRGLRYGEPEVYHPNVGNAGGEWLMNRVLPMVEGIYSHHQRIKR
jgi:hypothetical protein